MATKPKNPTRPYRAPFAAQTNRGHTGPTAHAHMGTARAAHGYQLAPHLNGGPPHHTTRGGGEGTQKTLFNWGQKPRGALTCAPAQKHSGVKLPLATTNVVHHADSHQVARRNR